MRKMTFGEELLQFAKTVDILDKRTFFQIKQIINDYAKERWGIEYVKIMKLKFDVDGNRILEKFFLSEYNEGETVGDSVNIDISKGQMAFVIKQKKPVWITAKDKVSRLNETDAYVDSWSHVENIPKYQSIIKDVATKTSIIVPFYELEKTKKYLRGVANYEISEHIEFHSECKREIEVLTDTISELLNLFTVRERQEKNTRFAIKKLKTKLKNFRHFRRSNKIFLASPYNGKKDVKESIKNVLKVHFSAIGIEAWESNRKTGSVTKNIFTKIDKCRYGICYFSDWDKKNELYFDNLNVMFEAGLMHQKFRTYKDENPLWIPIREVSKLESPFDIQGLNTIIVPRDEEGNLEVEAFEKRLQEFLVEMTKKVEKEKYKTLEPLSMTKGLIQRFIGNSKKDL